MLVGGLLCTYTLFVVLCCGVPRPCEAGWAMQLRGLAKVRDAPVAMLGLEAS